MLKNRIELAGLFRDQGYLRGAEVGVCTGRYSKILLDTIPGLHLISIDSYSFSHDQGSSRVQQTHYQNMETAHKLLAPYEHCLLVMATSHEASLWIPDGSLDFVFIDASHKYEHVVQDLVDWAPKVRPGGIVSGHDYYPGKYGNIGVPQAVDEYVAKHGYKLQTTAWDPEAHRDDRQPDFYWIKEAV